MIVTSFQVTILRDELPPKRSHPSAAREFKLEQLEKGLTQVIEMDTKADYRMVIAIRNYIHHALERDGTRLYRTVREPDKLIVKRVL